MRLNLRDNMYSGAGTIQEFEVYQRESESLGYWQTAAWDTQGWKTNSFDLPLVVKTATPGGLFYFRQLESGNASFAFETAGWYDKYC